MQNNKNNTPNFQFIEQDNTASVTTAPAGIVGIQGEFLRGPILDPSTIFFGWNQFKKIYGGFYPGSDAPLQVYRALQKGANVRINRVEHFTDLTNSNTLAAVKALLDDYYSITIEAGEWTMGQLMVTLNSPGNSGTVIADFVTDLPTSINALKAVMLADIPAIRTVQSFISISGVVTIIYTTSVDVTVLGTWSANGIPLNLPQQTFNDSVGITTLHNSPLFVPKLKYRGAAYNNAIFQIQNSSNGLPSCFNVVCFIMGEESHTTETYENLIINGFPTALESNYLSAISEGSLFDIEYIGTVGYPNPVGFLRPVNGRYRFGGGTNGIIVEADYVGTKEGGTGFHGFNDYDDMMQISAPAINTFSLALAGGEYAAIRKDLMYWAPVSGSLDFTEAVAAKQMMGIDNSYLTWIVGILEIKHPQTGVITTINPIGDILGIAATNDQNPEGGEWVSFMNEIKGRIIDCLSVTPNYGSAMKYDELNFLHQNGFNCVIQRRGKIMFWGNATAQSTNSITQKLNVRRLGIRMKKDLTAFAQKFLGEPNDIPTWFSMFVEVTPYLENLKDRRAYFSYKWEGDQNASNPNQLDINDPAQISFGKYKVKLTITPIAALGDFVIELNLDTAGQTVTATLV